MREYDRSFLEEYVVKHFLLSEMAETYDSYQTLKDCRYLRLRSSEQNYTNPFDIKEIFGKKE